MFQKVESVSLSGAHRALAVVESLVLEITAVSDLFEHRRECAHSRADPGLYGTATESIHIVVHGNPYKRGQEGVAGDWDSPERAFWWPLRHCGGGVDKHVFNLSGLY